MVEKLPARSDEHEQIVEPLFLIKSFFGLQLPVAKHFALVIFVIFIAIVRQAFFQDTGVAIDFQGFMNDLAIGELGFALSEQAMVFIGLPTAVIQTFVLKHEGPIEPIRFAGIGIVYRFDDFLP